MAASLGLLAVYDLAARLGFTLGLLALGFLALAWAARRLDTPAAAGPIAAAGSGLSSAGRGILLVAVLMRLPLVALPPTLSDDVLRYLWDGRVAAAGFNPYRLAPDAPELEPLRDETWRRLPHREVATVYPPLAMAAFSIAARLPAPVYVWKGLVALADLATVAMLLALARRRGVPEGRAVWYAWNPLVVLEGAGMGHVDILGAAAVVAVALLLTRRAATEGAALALPPRRPARRRPTPGRAGRGPAVAAALAAAGALSKLVPLAAMPMWARQSGRPWRFLVVALGLTAVALLPVVVATGGVPPGLVTYGVSWEFNGPLYEPLVAADRLVGLAPSLHGWLDQAKVWTGNYDLGNSLYPYIYPQLLAKLLLAGGMAWAVARSLRERDPLAGSGRLFGALLLCSATVYPWYLVWVLPWAALDRRLALARPLRAHAARLPAAVRGRGALPLGLPGDLGTVLRPARLVDDGGDEERSRRGRLSHSVAGEGRRSISSNHLELRIGFLRFA